MNGKTVLDGTCTKQPVVVFFALTVAFNAMQICGTKVANAIFGQSLFCTCVLNLSQADSCPYTYF
jgi:hypothetical protein